LIYIQVYIILNIDFDIYQGAIVMQTAKLIINGRSQAVRLPKAFRFDGTEVFISKVGQKVVLSAKPESWKSFFLSDKKPTPDFMEEREQLDLEERDIFK